MRRRAVISSALAALVGAAGCLSREEPRARVSWVAVRNDHDREYDVTLSLVDGEETAFSASKRLSADAPVFYVDSPVSGEGDYVVRATAGDETREVETTKHVDGDENCLAVQFLVTDGGSFVVDLVRSMQQC